MADSMSFIRANSSQPGSRNGNRDLGALSPKNMSKKKNYNNTKETWFDEMKNDPTLAQPKGVHTRQAMQT